MGARAGKHIFLRVLIGFILLYLIVEVGLFVAAQFVEPAEARGVLKSVFVLLLFPSIVLLPICLVLRRWLLSGIMAVALIALILSYAPLFIPRVSQPSRDAQGITFLTFNLQTATQQLDELADIIRDANADVVALQELSQTAADHLRQALQDVYPHHALYPHENPHAGQGILSKFPIDEEEYWRNQELSATLGHLRVVVNVGTETIVVFNTHPVPPVSFNRGLNIEMHSEAITDLLRRADEETAPVVLLGDFNMTDQFDEYWRIVETYTDTFREAGAVGFGFTFPNGKRLPLPPLLRLDYIFYDSQFEGLRARVFERSGPSDHLPLWAELRRAD